MSRRRLKREILATYPRSKLLETAEASMTAEDLIGLLDPEDVRKALLGVLAEESTRFIRESVEKHGVVVAEVDDA